MLHFFSQSSLGIDAFTVQIPPKHSTMMVFMGESATISTYHYDFLLWFLQKENSDPTIGNYLVPSNIDLHDIKSRLIFKKIPQNTNGIASTKRSLCIIKIKYPLKENKTKTNGFSIKLKLTQNPWARKTLPLENTWMIWRLVGI